MPFNLVATGASGDEGLDLSFYIERALEFCEHFVIYELEAIQQQ